MFVIPVSIDFTANITNYCAINNILGVDDDAAEE